MLYVPNQDAGNLKNIIPTMAAIELYQRELNLVL